MNGGDKTWVMPKSWVFVYAGEVWGICQQSGVSGLHVVSPPTF